MKLTNTHQHKATTNGFRLSLQSFINRHASVFEALTRQATPFGGNWLPVGSGYATTPNRVQQQMAHVRQQVDELTQAVHFLRDQIENLESPQTRTSRKPVRNEIGINRFRAQQAS